MHEYKVPKEILDAALENQRDAEVAKMKGKLHHLAEEMQEDLTAEGDTEDTEVDATEQKP